MSPIYVLTANATTGIAMKRVHSTIQGTMGNIPE